MTFKGHKLQLAPRTVSFFSQPDTAHVSAVLEFLRPGYRAVPLPQGLATHYSDREIRGRALAGRYDASGDALVQGRHRFISAERPQRDRPDHHPSST